MKGNSAAIVVAAGSGSRLGADAPKAFVRLPGGTILEHALRSLFEEGVSFAAVALPPGLGAAGGFYIPAGMEVLTTEGGARRQDSVLNAASLLPEDAAVVLVHDAARPFLRPGVTAELIDAATAHGAAVPALPCPDTLKRVRDGIVERTVEREGVFLVQTPQAFRRDVFSAMLPLYGEKAVTDDAALAEAAGFRPRVVTGSAVTFKITRPEDLELAAILAERRTRR